MHRAEVTVPGTTAYEEALQLQIDMYRHATRAGSKAFEDIVHFSAERMTLIALYPQGSDSPLCSLKVVRPPETLIQSLICFAPGSLSARELDSGRFAELGGFAIRAGVERGEIPDLLDAIALALLHLTDPAVTSFWLLPRRHLMRLFRAEIPHMLPPYRIELCHDVLRWNERSTMLHELREIHFKGHHAGSQGGTPYVYMISRQAIAEDVTQRMALLQERRQHPAFVHLLTRAMCQAQRDVQQELDVLHGVENNDDEHL
jgi:hypothetical protein